MNITESTAEDAALLPKLVSGELRVNDAERFVSETCSGSRKGFA